MTARTVNSATDCSGWTKGWNSPGGAVELQGLLDEVVDVAKFHRLSE